MKLDKTVIANASALTTAILWVICCALVAIIPRYAWTVSNWWALGILIAVKGAWKLTMTNFLLGGATLTIVGWVSGYIFGWAWEKCSKK